MLVFADENLFELSLVHDLHCVIVFGVLINTLYDFSEFSTSDLFHNDVLIDDLFPAHLFGDGRDGGDASLAFQILRTSITYGRERSSAMSSFILIKAKEIQICEFFAYFSRLWRFNRDGTQMLEGLGFFLLLIEYISI